MLKLYQSNNMAVLAEAFCAHQDDVASVFEPTTVVVQSVGMGQWLKHQLAYRSGIAANVNALLPAELIWQLYQSVLVDKALPPESMFSRQRLTWQIMHLLPLCTGNEFAEVHRYINRSDSQLHLFQLSDNIAGLFDKYLVYRPEWLAAWERGDKIATAQAGWQATLWQQLVQLNGMDAGLHRASLHNAFLQGLNPNNPQARQQPIPQRRISAFGLSSLPPIHVQTLQAVAQWIDVDIYFLNPCQHYWGDIVSEKDASKRSIRRLLEIQPDQALEEDDYLEVGNPILASMGKQGREFFEILLDTPDVEGDELFFEHASGDALARVKNDILDMAITELQDEPEDEPEELAPTDTSIQIHLCHSPLREVEVLFDQIHLLSETHSDMTARDIIVMAPDISQYAPFIQSVFSDKIQFNITDRPITEASSILDAFEQLMNLPDARLNASEVMALLETPAIANKFNFDETALTTLNHWIKASGIRWELDGKSKHEHWQVPNSDQHTFKFGLQRLLLGFAMHADMNLFSGISPFDINPSDRVLLGSICQFIDLISHYREVFSTNADSQTWRINITAMLEDFFKPDQSEEISLNLVRNQLDRFSVIVSESEFEHEVSPQLVRDWLQTQLSNQLQSRSFISGGITFANLVPMRSIPFKMVCLLGMNDREYPRQETTASFDLMNQAARKGDRSRRHDDRYLFLEALLSAEQCFYVSYQGRSQINNSERPASVLVAELQDYLARIYGKRNFTTQHPLQPFNAQYFDAANAEFHSYNCAWFDALNRSSNEPVVAMQSFVDTPLPVPDTLALTDISQLIAFIKNPAQYFLQTQLGIYFSDTESDVQLSDSEPFELDGLETYQLADSALKVLVAGDDLAQWQAWVLAKGDVLSARPGLNQLATAKQKANAIYEGISPFIAQQARFKQGAVKLHQGNISGNLIVYGDTLVTYQASKLRKHQQLAVWVKHLFHHALDKKTAEQSYFVCQHNTKPTAHDLRTINPIDQATATMHLQHLADLYQVGMSSPLPLLPELSWRVYEQYGKAKALAPAMQKALSGYANQIEASDPYYARIFANDKQPALLGTEAFHDLAMSVYEPMAQYWEKLK